jgi:hypothetical protein
VEDRNEDVVRPRAREQHPEPRQLRLLSGRCRDEVRGYSGIGARR